MCEGSFLANPEFWFWFGLIAAIMVFLFWYLERGNGPTFLELDYMQKLKCDRKTAQKYLSRR